MAQSPRLAARCPVCLTTFRVVADQLKLRSGLVRCGKCDTVFDGRDHLLTLPAATPGTPDSPSTPVAPGNAPVEAASHAVDRTSAEETIAAGFPVDHADGQDGATLHSVHAGHARAQTDDGPTADADTPNTGHACPPGMPATPGATATPESEPDAHGVTPLSADASDDAPSVPAIASLLITREIGAATESESESESASASASAAQADITAADRLDASQPETLPATDAAAGTARNATPHPMRYRAAPLGAHRWVFRAAPCTLSATALPQPVPDFVRAAKDRTRAAQAPTRWLWRGLFTALVLAAAAQAIYWWRGPLAAAYPVLRPALLRVCAPLQCTIPPARHIERLVIDGTQLQKPDETHDHYLLSLNLRSRDTAHIALPALELVLTDLDDHVITRRVLLPAEYLPPSERALLHAGLAPDGELALRVRFQSQQPAVNYRVLMFYP